MDSKWHGSVKATVQAAPDKLWQIASDFCGLHKWIPMIMCELIEGDPQQPGCIRYIEGSSFSGSSSSTSKSWAKEKLLSIDFKSYSLSYAVTESSLGLDGYIATLTISKGPEISSLVDWSFELDPVVGSSKEKTVSSMCAVLAKYIKYLADAARAN